MNETIATLAAITSMISALAAVGAVVMSVLAYIASRKNGKKIEEVHVSINSRMDQLLQARGDASEAKGLEQGRNEGKPPVADDTVKVEIVKIPPMAKA